MSDPVELLDLARTIARDVGTEAAERRQTGFSWSTKSSSADVVTEIDTWAEDTIVARIGQARPDDGLIGEEGTNRTGTSGISWVIDPIDGTTNFLYDIVGWSVSIAASDGTRALAGAVYDPVRDELFSASLGGGAHRNDSSISVSSKDELATALIATGFGYAAERRAHQADVLTRVLPHVRDIRRLGGAALDLCAVACGRVDAYFERGLSPWDSAAGALIAAEAGAHVVDDALTWACGPQLADAFGGLIEGAGA